MADDGWLGIAMPEEYGGAGLGITEAAIMMQTVAESGAGMSGASAIHINIFGLNPVVVFGTDEQKRAHAAADDRRARTKACFAVTEPNTGLNTTQLKTTAERHGDRYVVNGQKVWISTAQVADKMLLLARTTPLEKVKTPTDGLTLFYTDFDRNRIEVREIEKMGRKAVDSNEVFIDGLRNAGRGPHRRGRQGLRVHPARPQSGAHPDRRRSGRARQGRADARRGLRQGAHRVRPADRPEPGHPASAGAKLDGARGRQADDLQGRRGSTTRASRAAPTPTPPSISPREAGFDACQPAIMTHGGFGYAKEFHVERYFREVMIPRHRAGQRRN